MEGEEGAEGSPRGWVFTTLLLKLGDSRSPAAPILEVVLSNVRTVVLVKLVLRESSTTP